MTEIYLGYPPPNTKKWIEDHSPKPITQHDPVFPAFVSRDVLLANAAKNGKMYVQHYPGGGQSAQIIEMTPNSTGTAFSATVQMYCNNDGQFHEARYEAGLYNGGSMYFALCNPDGIWAYHNFYDNGGVPIDVQITNGSSATDLADLRLTGYNSDGDYRSYAFSGYFSFSYSYIPAGDADGSAALFQTGLDGQGWFEVTFDHYLEDSGNPSGEPQPVKVYPVSEDTTWVYEGITTAKYAFESGAPDSRLIVRIQMDPDAQHVQMMLGSYQGGTWTAAAIGQSYYYGSSTLESTVDFTTATEPDYIVSLAYVTWDPYGLPLTQFIQPLTVTFKK